MRGVDFSIVTPSFRNSAWLRLCVASVADQHGVTLEHIVQDAVSDDGTLDWLREDRRVRVFVEEDSGMYDAINRGLRRASGDLLACLNCDEQYLPGALAAVKEFFGAQPEVEVVFADAVVVGPGGQFVAYRKTVTPSRRHVQVCHLPTLTCATFFRHRSLERHGLFFDSQWRDVGDGAWVVRMLEKGVRVAVLRRYTSAFTRTGQNMNFLPNAIREKAVLRAAAPLWVRALAPLWVAGHRLAKWRHGCYHQPPFQYAIYTQVHPDRRTTFAVDRPTFHVAVPEAVS
jgi:glycosyltransferase involved in cell wall biosynthesis